MDASRFKNAAAIEKMGMDAAKAARLMLATELRDLADEVEAGIRRVVEFITTESVRVEGHDESAMFLRTRLGPRK